MNLAKDFYNGRTQVYNRAWIDELLLWAKDHLKPIYNGYYILKIDMDPDSPTNFYTEFREYALSRKLLVNPTREEMVEYIPRAVFKSENLGDKVENGYIIVEQDHIFWSLNEDKYQKWLTKERN